MAMQDMFVGGQVHHGGFRADLLEVTFGATEPGQTLAGFLVQQIQFSYTQQVSMIYEIGSNYVYYVGGRAQGTATLARVVGPSQLSGAFINKYNDLCCPQDIWFKAGGGCGGSCANGASSIAGTAGAGVEYHVDDALITAISVSVTAQEVVINEQLQFMFIGLQVDTASGGSGDGAFGGGSGGGGTAPQLVVPPGGFAAA